MLKVIIFVFLAEADSDEYIFMKVEFIIDSGISRVIIRKNGRRY